MSPFRKLAAVAAVATAAATVLAGCGGDDDAGPSGATTLKLLHYESANSAMGMTWERSIWHIESEHRDGPGQVERTSL